MEETFYWLLGYWIEFVKVYIVLLSFFRCKFHPYIIPSVMFFSVFSILITQFISDDIYNSAFVIAIAFINIFILICKKKDVLLAVLAFACISIIDVALSGVIVSLLNIQVEEVLEDYLLSTMLNMQSLIPLAIVYRWLDKRKPEKVIISDKALKGIFLVIVGLILAVFLFVPMQIISLNVNDQHHGYKLLILTICILVFMGFAILNIVNIIKNEQSERDNEVYKCLLEKQKELYVNLLEHESETKKFRHDIYHHMNCIKEYLDAEEINRAKTYLDSVYGFVKYSYFISTGNVCMDIVINNVWKDYRGKINLKWNGMFPPEITLSDVDTCILFSNLFMNALEATTDAEQDEIIATTKILGSNIVFILENPYKQIETEPQGMFRTTKSGNHGYGLRNMKEVIDKYDGHIEFNAEELFSVEIILIHAIRNME